MATASQTEEIRRYLLENIPGNPKGIIAQTSAHFQLTRPAIHRHLRALIAEGRVIKTGVTRSTEYRLSELPEKSWRFQISPNLHESKVWEDHFEEEFRSLPENIYNICLYGLTEMFNNAIDHSEGQTISTGFEIENGTVKIFVKDDGCGIFKKIQETLRLQDIRESILHLSKGKLTTDPERHTGQGIFFTSRAFDHFVIESGPLRYECIDHDQDWFFQSMDDLNVQGTTVIMELNLDSNTNIVDVFRAYEDDDQGFTKTNVAVKLTVLKDERYVSRSQAKMLTAGLEKFEKIVLDFKQVKTVGQAFVDQVFRVFQNQYPRIKIEYINANSDIDFMIQRGLPKLDPRGK